MRSEIVVILAWAIVITALCICSEARYEQYDGLQVKASACCDAIFEGVLHNESVDTVMIGNATLQTPLSWVMPIGLDPRKSEEI